MAWNRKTNTSDGGYFKCRIKAAEWRREFRAQRQAAGLCIQCGSNELDTEILCRPCADTHAALQNRSDQYLKHIFAQARHRKRERAAEGYKSTLGATALEGLLEERVNGQV
jgi:hypothetical protein